MKRVLVVFMSLVLALVGWTTVCADDGFYVVAGQKANYAPVPKTGQTNPYGLTGTDGALQKGVAWPTPRFTDNGNGTVTDNLTGLIWTQNANIGPGYTNWTTALSAANSLASGSYGLNDGSQAGEWRLPNVQELHSLVDYSRTSPALPVGHPFTNVSNTQYWTSTTATDSPTIYAWYVSTYNGVVGLGNKGQNVGSVWCVRGGK